MPIWTRLPDPDVLAADIIETLQSALDSFNELMSSAQDRILTEGTTGILLSAGEAIIVHNQAILFAIVEPVGSGNPLQQAMLFQFA